MSKLMMNIKKIWQDRLAQILIAIFSVGFGISETVSSNGFSILLSIFYVVICYLSANAVYYFLIYHYEPNNIKLKSKQGFTEKYFSWLITFICLALFTFNFWLFYPGYITHDLGGMMVSFSLNGYHPVIYSFLFKKLTDIFGYHLYYPLLFNLVSFYLGIYIFILAIWNKFQTKFCLLGLLPICIYNIFFSNIIGNDCFSSPMFIFFLYSIVFWQILNGITRKNIVVFVFAFIMACMSRHNALIQVYPIFFVYSYLIIQKLRPSYSLLKYIGLLFIFFILTIIISLGIPHYLREGNAYPANHVFLHQMAGACVPSHDTSCFKQEWYMPGKTFVDVEEEYKKNPLYADIFGQNWEVNRPFQYAKLDGLYAAWICGTAYGTNYCRYS